VTPASTVPARARLEIVEGLRGLAALAVAWFHFTNANTTFPSVPWLRASGTYGWLGVESFFVISGFIIPYAMFMSGYRRSNWRTFMAKRLLRLEPSYLVAIAVTLALWWLSSHSPGFARPAPSATAVLLHVAYLPTLFGYPWLDTSYWTLGIEFQYYLLMAAAFSWLAHPARRVRLACFGIACALSFALPSELLVFRYLALFALGAATFWKHARLVSRTEYYACLVVSTLAVAAMFGAAVAAVGATTALLIAFGHDLRWRPMAWLGTVSYSLYLLHGPMGERVVNLGARYARSPLSQLLVMFGALAVSIGAAVVVYRLVERPALRLSATLRYRPADGPGAPAMDRKTGANARS
jgi:peptidoglycan/LPS O-acetylase OafA/YrhL